MTSTSEDPFVAIIHRTFGRSTPTAPAVAPLRPPQHVAQVRMNSSHSCTFAQAVAVLRVQTDGLPAPQARLAQDSAHLYDDLGESEYPRKVRKVYQVVTLN